MVVRKWWSLLGSGLGVVVVVVFTTPAVVVLLITMRARVCNVSHLSDDNAPLGAECAVPGLALSKCRAVGLNGRAHDVVSSESVLCDVAAVGLSLPDKLTSTMSLAPHLLWARTTDAAAASRASAR